MNLSAPDLAEATRFLRTLGVQHTFQTFDESGAGNHELTRVLHGTLSKNAQALTRLNACGAGVFVMVNSGDGRGRKTSNVRSVRAVFVDLDGSPLKPVLSGALPPQCIVESSLGRWHAYWLVADCSLDHFKPLQQALAERFGGDPKVCDLSRVMRLPGFDHRKGKPCRVRIVTMDDRAPYTLAELVRAFDLGKPTALPPPATKRELPDAISEGERNATLLSLACGLVWRGFDARVVNSRIQQINVERCQPPLDESEVGAIVTRAVGYGSDGYARLPHRLLDSPEWKALANPAKVIVLVAFRRYDRTPNCRVVFTPEDFAGWPGLGKNTFYKHRAAVLSSGIMVCVGKGVNKQTGHTFDILALAPKWLPGESASTKNWDSRQSQKVTTYIDKRSLEAFRALGVETAQKKSEAA